MHGEVPTIDLVMGYSKSNTSPLIKKFLLRADELASGRSRDEDTRRMSKGQKQNIGGPRAAQRSSR
ncbi:hypothetical protein ACPOL_5549 [Acidisarcina polymorpha]|uniref:Uncharacterized protein n=1 Tax=Acidisarcina polymorpha TaxID=2211140 RepID=A0A2Z5G7L0_9BACT|nr:hypothetical protein ACPOL_5549 [Acidisarcina polymorpha]